MMITIAVQIAWIVVYYIYLATGIVLLAKAIRNRPSTGEKYAFFLQNNKNECKKKEFSPFLRHRVRGIQ